MTSPEIVFAIFDQSEGSEPFCPGEYFKMAAPLVQYVVVRSDLIHALKWPTGALIAQACHACSAVIHLFHDDPSTKAYTADLDNMHKVVLEVSQHTCIIAHVPSAPSKHTT